LSFYYEHRKRKNEGEVVFRKSKVQQGREILPEVEGKGTTNLRGYNHRQTSKNKLEYVVVLAGK
jgi:hypothetical protein